MLVSTGGSKDRIGKLNMLVFTGGSKDGDRLA